MDLQIVALGIEKVNRSSRLPDVFLIHDLGASLLEVRYRGGEIFLGQFKRNVGSAVVEVSPLNRLGSLKKNQVRAVLHKKPGSQGIVTHCFFVETARFDIDIDLCASHAKNFRVKLLRTFQIIDWKTEVVNAFYFKHCLPPLLLMSVPGKPCSFRC